MRLTDDRGKSLLGARVGVRDRFGRPIAQALTNRYGIVVLEIPAGEDLFLDVSDTEVVAVPVRAGQVLGVVLVGAPQG